MVENPVIAEYVYRILDIISTMPSPWGASSEKLFQIYANASADDYECLVVVADTKHKSCGQSRFACWMCTVVKEGKSMRCKIAC
jgi:DNA sulfur modification protein DndC